MTAAHFFGAWALTAGLVCAANNAAANVVISGTRVVFDAKQRETVVRLTNNGEMPVLVQAWLDSGDASQVPEASKQPFVISPPLSRLDPKKGQALRIVYVDETLPKDRESLYWLNVLEIPPRAADSAKTANQLQLTFRSRIKLFYRPVGLPGDAGEAPAQMAWKVVEATPGKYALQVSNPTPYYVNLTRVQLHVGTQTVSAPEPVIVEPLSSRSIEAPALSGIDRAPISVDYTFINDYGAAVEGKYEPNDKP